MELREKIAEAANNELIEAGAYRQSLGSDIADAILALPEIREALEVAGNLRDNRHRMLGPSDDWLRENGGGMMPGA